MESLLPPRTHLSVNRFERSRISLVIRSLRFRVSTTAIQLVRLYRIPSIFPRRSYREVVTGYCTMIKRFTKIRTRRNSPFYARCVLPDPGFPGAATPSKSRAAGGRPVVAEERKVSIDESYAEYEDGLVSARLDRRACYRFARAHSLSGIRHTASLHRRSWMKDTRHATISRHDLTIRRRTARSAVEIKLRSTRRGGMSESRNQILMTVGTL